MIAAGLFVRLDDIKVWTERKDFFFVEGRPIFSSYDAFYFARLAKDLEEGIYEKGKVDPFRFVPDNFLENSPRYPLIPLMSYSAQKLSKLFNASLEEVAFYYSPATAVLSAIPIFLYMKALGYPSAGLLGGMCLLTSFIYVVRTSVMRFDTDSLNLFFPFFTAYAFYMVFVSKKKLFWTASASLSLLLFMWWYQHPELVWISTLPFLFLLFLKRKEFSRKDLALILLVLFLPNAWYLWKAPVEFLVKLKEVFLRSVSPSQAGLFADFPNIGQSISELQKFQTLKDVSPMVLDNTVLFTMGLVLAVAFFWKERFGLFLILPYFFIGLLVFKLGNRYGIFLAPFVGMGLGFALDFLSKRLLKGLPFERVLLYALAFLSIAGVYFLQDQSRKFVATPKMSPFVARDMMKLRELLPEDAWIWSWWDYGYAFQYYSRRGVFIDGGSQGSPKTYYVALSFALPSQKEAYNVISFVAKEGLSGIRKRLASGKTAKELTSEIRSGKYAQGLERPVYWVFTQDMPPKYGWIGYFGSWNFELKKGKFGGVQDLNPCRKLSATSIACKNAVIEFEKGFIELGFRRLPIKEVILRNKEGRLIKKSYAQRGVIVEMVDSKYGRLVYAVSENSFSSNFNVMYVLRVYDSRFFELVLDDFPFMVVYRARLKGEL